MRASWGKGLKFLSLTSLIGAVTVGLVMSGAPASVAESVDAGMPTGGDSALVYADVVPVSTAARELVLQEPLSEPLRTIVTEKVAPTDGTVEGLSVSIGLIMTVDAENQSINTLVEGENQAQAIRVKLPGELNTHQDGKNILKASGRDIDMVAHPTLAGGQVASIAKSPEAANFHLQTEIFPNSKWEAHPDGSVSLIDGQGIRLGGFSTLSAFDATGKPLKTSVQVTNDVISYQVETGGAEFPVFTTADWKLWVACGAEIASFFVAWTKGPAIAYKVVKILNRNERIKKVHVGSVGNLKTLAQGLKDWVNKKNSVAANGVKAFVDTLGGSLKKEFFHLIGVGSCFAILLK